MARNGAEENSKGINKVWSERTLYRIKTFSYNINCQPLELLRLKRENFKTAFFYFTVICGTLFGFEIVRILWLCLANGTIFRSSLHNGTIYFVLLVLKHMQWPMPVNLFIHSHFNFFFFISFSCYCKLRQIWNDAMLSAR